MLNRLELLKHISVFGFKSIKQLELDLKPLNIIIGQNGAGKSNFIGVFSFLYQVVQKNLQSYIAQFGGADRFLYFGAKETSELKFKLNFGVNDYSLNLKNSVGDVFTISNETGCFQADNINYSGKTKCYSFAPVGSFESDLSDAGKYEIEHYIFKYMHGFKVYHFHDTTMTSPLKKKNNINDSLCLNSDGSNLATILHKLKYTQEYQKYYKDILSSVQIVAPFIQDFVLEPEGNYILLRWKHKGTDKLFDAYDLSDGTLRFVALAALLCQPLEMMPYTILLDEPELGLHPLALKVLAEMVQSVAKQGRQVIATSQSVTFINQFKAEDIIVADRKDEQSVFRRLAEDEIKSWLEEYAIGDIWEREIIGGTPDVY